MVSDGNIIIGKTTESDFWHWFQANEDRIFNFEQDQDKIFDELSFELSKIHPNLTFAISGIEEGKREFVISANGIKEAFPFVESLFEKSPILPKWQIVKFRPRGDSEVVKFVFEGREFSTANFLFNIEPDGYKIGLTFFIKDYRESEKDLFFNVLFILLDHTLGEYDVETKVGFIEIVPFWTESKLLKYKFVELPEIFDKMFRQMSH